MFDFIFEAIGDLFDLIGDVVAILVGAVLSFFDWVVDYFRGLKLRRGRDIPFIADERKLADLIHKAPQKNVGIFQGVYNEDTDKIEHYRSLEADEMDEDLKRTLGREKLVVLN